MLSSKLPKSGLVAVVTGGASGMGEATVKELFKEGCKVVIVDRDASKGQTLCKDLNSENVIFIETDISKEESVKDMVSQVVKKFGGIQILVNSAGILPEYGTMIDSISSTKFKEVFETNVFGTYWVCQHTSAIMVKQDAYNDKGEKGVIIMISSVCGTDGHAGLVSYSGTKGAINAFTLPMARELGPLGVRVVTLAPAMIKTPMFDKASTKEALDYALKITPLGRVGGAEEVANCVSSICTLGYITGEIIRVDGGFR